MKFIFRKISYDAFKGAVPDGKTQDTKGYLVFPVPLAQENSQKPLSGRVILLT
jgi:hypothetical protein